MADNQEQSPFGNFSIEDTMGMGMGNSELLNDLLSPETSTSNPDDVTDITDAPVVEAPVKKAPKKSIIPTDDDEDEEKDKPSASKSIEDFISGNDEDEDDDSPAPAATQSDDDDEAPAEVSKFTALSNDLFKLGVFTNEDESDEEPITTPEQFLERFQEEKKKGAIEVVNNFISQFGEDYQSAFQSIFVNGVDPKEYYGTYNAIQNFTDLDLSDEGNQVAIMKQALTDAGYDQEDIDQEIEKVKNYGDLETTAARHHKVLIKKEALKLHKLEEDRTAQLQQQNNIKQQYLQNVNTVLQDKVKNKEFDGIPINPKLAGELQDFLITDKWKLPSGEMLTDFDRTILELKRPENHEKKVKLGLLLKILEKDPTLSTIQKSGVTKKSNELFGEVARQTSKSAVKSSKPSSNSWFA